MRAQENNGVKIIVVGIFLFNRPSSFVFLDDSITITQLSARNEPQAGLPRTSTTSLKKAFDLLGIGPCFHLGDPPAPIFRVKQSARTLQTADHNVRLEMLRKLYDGFEAVFEPPGSACVDDMMQVYPTAKVSINSTSYLRAWKSKSTRSSLV